MQNLYAFFSAPEAGTPILFDDKITSFYKYWKCGFQNIDVYSVIYVNIAA